MKQDLTELDISTTIEKFLDAMTNFLKAKNPAGRWTMRMSLTT
jgi:hypothetical protein